MSLRDTFDVDAELYDCARPSYPNGVVDELERWLPDRAHLLEIGCGTGKATRALVDRGYQLTCVELGANLAAVARRNVPEAEIVHADFETWAPDARFDAVVCFTAFHWLDQATRYERCARHLDPGGMLGIVETQHVLPPDGDPFFVEVQEDYDDSSPPPPPEDVPDLVDEIDASGYFETMAVSRILWDVEYDANAYTDVLSTYSGHIALADADREALFARIRRRIGARTVRKTYLAGVNVARRL